MLPARILPHTVEVAGPTIDTPEGPILGTPDTVPAYVEERSSLVAVEGGQEVVSPVQVWMNLADVTIGAAVTIWPGSSRERHLTVVGIDRYEWPARGAHVVLKLA